MTVLLLLVGLALQIATQIQLSVVFHDESNNLLDDTGGFTYNPNSGNLAVPGNITAKTFQSLTCSFFDDLGTTKHYIPISTQSTSESPRMVTHLQTF